mmetsp:Transcript_10566/g.26622  ORF Transcript_10566/g.26622 Transcript_10566/m.26622 type:complete len:697 (-) Transcript_10566:7-2097(-)
MSSFLDKVGLGSGGGDVSVAYHELKNEEEEENDEETDDLEFSAATASVYPSSTASSSSSSSSSNMIEMTSAITSPENEDVAQEQTKNDQAAEDADDTPNWRKELATLSTLLPYLWPEGQLHLRVRVVISLLLMVLAKLLTVLIPITYKNAVDQLGSADPSFPVGWVIGYAVLRLGSKACADVRNAVFVRVTQNALKTAALETFAHLHSLSLRFHVQRKTGGVLRAISRGTQGIMWLLTFLLFNIAPTFIELTMVILYMLIGSPPYFALATFLTIAGYIVYTLLITEWRNKFRREMNDKDNEANDLSVDSLLNFETVKYFSNEEHELNRYAEALDGYVEAQVKSQTSLALLNIGQAGIIGAGTCAVMMLAAWKVVTGDLTVGDFVLMNTYILQLSMPLNFLGSSYRMIKRSLVDLESMFKLLDEHPDIEDAPGAPDLIVDRGEVRFEGVHFAYSPETPILKNVSFVVPAGHMVALVGATGSGKSTVARLLFRFYDTQVGTITIDGQNIREVSQSSLRRAVGVVPQDTVLFNSDIRYNIKYGRPSCSDSEMYQAAKLAQIHDFIMSLPDGYATKVGERGLRLSGGEAQRVSIARAILKDPPIMFYDESTSALDTKTEKEIQAALREVSVGRTTICIAHRLSTTVDANQILVMKEGRIVERGSHQELLAIRGEYYEMWQAQQDAAQDATGDEDQSPLLL